MKLCFTTYVYGWYQDFIATYIYSILHNWPHHFVKIYLHESLKDYNKKALEMVRSRVGANFEIVENYQDVDDTEIPHLASLRFLMRREEFEGFDYVYFGDVDFINYNVFNDNFYDTYVAQCRKTRLPFSNEWDYDYNRWRATGLLFIIKDKYYDAMKDIIEEMRIPNGNHFRNQAYCPGFREEQGVGKKAKFPNYDEEMLYYMLCKTFDLRPLIGYRRPLHGFHFGTFRRVETGHSFVVNKLHSDEKEYLPVWRENLDKIEPVLKSNVMDFVVENGDERTSQTVRKAKAVLYNKMFV